MTPSQQTARQPAKIVLLAVLLIANVLLYAAWPWLRQMPVGGDTSQPFLLRNIIRNEEYLAQFFDGIRENRKILFLGTSESMPPYNLAAQLNALGPTGRYLAALSKGGNSPIHSALAIARAKREGLQFPPIILVINPVYFTESHDIIDDGWMSDMVRSPVFLQMNHRDIRDYLSPEVQNAYDDHFTLKRLLYPATMQEYLSNLLYLSFHQPVDASQDKVPLPMPVYQFSGDLPSYDNEKNVWSGNEAVDRFSKSRWQVHSVEDSVNLKGLAAIVSILKREPAPVLLLFLPVNRSFYKYHDLDMKEFDRRYRDIRNVLQQFSQEGNIYLLDLYDFPVRFGFRDRMHMDQFGFFQLASHIMKDETYLRFLQAAKTYYDVSIGAQTFTHREQAEQHLKVSGEK
jgi:DltD protein